MAFQWSGPRVANSSTLSVSEHATRSLYSDLCDRGAPSVLLLEDLADGDHVRVVGAQSARLDRERSPQQRVAGILAALRRAPPLRPPALARVVCWSPCRCSQRTRTECRG